MRQAQYGIDLTRGVQTVATNWIPSAGSEEAQDIANVNKVELCTVLPRHYLNVFVVGSYLWRNL